MKFLLNKLQNEEIKSLTSFFVRAKKADGKMLKTASFILCCVFCLALAVCQFVLKPTQVTASAVWDGISLQEIVIGNGTKDAPFEISTAAQLAFLAEEINSGNSPSNTEFFYYILTNDIYFNSTNNWSDNDFSQTDKLNAWVPIGKFDSEDVEKSKAFKANFDGKGFCIKGIFTNSANSFQGLFGYVSGGAVQNVSIEDSYISGGGNIGSIVGYADCQSKIINCSSLADVVCGDNYVGGIAGYITNSEIQNCSFGGNVQGTGTQSGYAGGIVGVAFNGSKIANCYNTGKVFNASVETGYIGGVVGLVYDKVQITNCYNSGTVENNHYYVGGIAGYIYSSAAANCSNFGQVFGLHYVGGVAGYCYDGSIEYCYYIFDGTSGIGGGTGTATDFYSLDAFVSGYAYVNGNYFFTLIDALNAWVEMENNFGGNYLYFMAETDYSCCFYFANHTVTFNYCDDTNMINILDVIDGNAITEPEKPQRPGYTFAGWWTSDDNGLTLLAEWNFEQAVTANIILCAKWIADVVTYTVTFKYCDEFDTTDTMQVISGNIVVEPENPNRNGYTFAGWWTGDDNGLTLLEEWNCEQAVTENITLYAKWIADEIVFKVTFKYCDEIGTTDTIDVTDGNTVVEPEKPQRPGYTFAGWRTSDDNGLTLLEEWNFEHLVIENLTLYAKWIADVITYTVTFNYCDEIGTTDTKDITDGNTVVEPEKPQREGYIFAGWWASQDNGLTLLEEWDFEQLVIDSLILYAKWIADEITYTITFNYCDEVGTTGTIDVTAHNAAVEPNIPQKTGYIFAGWWISEDGGLTLLAEWNFEQAITANTILYAKWVVDEITYAVTFKYCDEIDTTNTIDVLAGDIVVEPENPQRAGYTFAGWWTSEDNGLTLLAEWNFEQLVNENLVLYVKWIADIITFTVTFVYCNDANTTDAIDVTAHNVAVEPEKMQRDGYTFAGWWTSEDNGLTFLVIWDFEQAVTENIILYAKWIGNSFSITINLDSASVDDVQYNGAPYCGNIITLNYIGSPMTGKQFAGYEIDGEDTSIIYQSGTYYFVMPSRDIIITVLYEDIIYGIISDFTLIVYGTLKYGDEITVAYINKEVNKKFLGFSAITAFAKTPITISEFDGIYSFIMPNDDVIIVVLLEDIVEDYGGNSDNGGNGGGGSNSGDNGNGGNTGKVYTIYTVSGVSYEGIPLVKEIIFLSYNAMPPKGKMFAGFLINDGTIPVFILDGKYAFEMPSKDVTVSVLFADETYIIIAGEEISYTGTTKFNSTITLKYVGTPPIGKKFAGVEVNGGEVSIFEKDGIYTFDMPASDVYITALYSYITYSVRCSDDIEYLGELKYGKEIILFFTGETPFGKELYGFEIDGEIITANDDGLYSFIMLPNDITIVAVFVAKTFNVVFKNWDGTILTTQSVEFNASAIAPTEGPIKQSTDEYRYVFNGWSEDFDCVTQNLDIIAVFIQIKQIYMITFDLNGGSGTIPTSVVVEYGNTIIAPNDYWTKEGYAHDYIWIDGDGNVFDFSTNIITKNIILYLKWRYATVTFLSNPNMPIALPNEVFSSYPSDNNLPVLIAPAGFNFLGWITDKGEAINQIDRLLGDIVLMPVWELISPQVQIFLTNDYNGNLTLIAHFEKYENISYFLQWYFLFEGIWIEIESMTNQTLDFLYLQTGEYKCTVFAVAGNLSAVGIYTYLYQAPEKDNAFVPFVASGVGVSASGGAALWGFLRKRKFKLKIK